MPAHPSTPNACRPYRGLAIAGAILVSISSIVGSGFNPMAVPFALWSLLPYVIVWVAGSRLRDPWIGAGAGAAALAADLGIRAAVFVWPRGSTAAIALVFSPALIAAIVLPVGAAAGWLCGMAWRWRPVGRAITVIVAPLAVGLLVLGLARPELFPTTVVRRRALLERVGAPRVVVGVDAFESVAVSTASAWYMAAELDGQPGDEVAIVDHRGADLLDSATMQAKGRVEFGDEARQLWGSFSALVRLPDGRLAVAQTGGGFSRTLVQGLDGAELWDYRPNPTLPSDALRPADLDRDGQVEFYASSTDRVVRLDAAGREVWRRPASLAALTAALPAADGTPAWIVGVEYGRRAVIWDAAGGIVAARATTAEDSPIGAIDSFAGRVVIHGGRSARGFDVSGKLAFEVPLGDFTLSAAHGARIAPESPSVVLIGSTEREARRFRLLVVAAGELTVYDEILDHYPRVIIARRADGSDAILVAGAQGLRWLCPKTECGP